MDYGQLRQIAEEYVLQQRNRHDLRYPDQARSQCANASSELAARYGDGGNRIRLHDHRDPGRLDDPHPGGDESEVHYAVYVEGAVVDVTRRQFDHSADVPTIYATFEDAARDWRRWSPDEDSEDIRPLPVGDQHRGPTA